MIKFSVARCKPPRALDLVLLVLLVSTALGIWAGLFATIEQPRADALRYLDYAANLQQHGIFGRGQGSHLAQPGRENMPLYPALVASILRLSDADPKSYRCFFKRDSGVCPTTELRPVLYVQTVISALSAIGVWLFAWSLLGRRVAWLSLAALALSGQLTEYPGQLLIENISLLCWSWLALFILLSLTGQRRWILACGITIGALTLSRPEFIYLGYAAIAVLALSALVVSSRRQAFARATIFALGFAVVCAPWVGRNLLQFGSPALTVSYGAHTLAQRVQYNRMSYTEVAVAFIYWLPDFGDSLARRWFPESTYDKLDFSSGSYYADGRPYYRQRLQAADDATTIQASLLRDDVLTQPFKHALVSIALSWRGLFVGKLWGLIGLLGFGVALWRMPTMRPYLVLVSLPAWFMMALYGAVSVSVPRYAICLVPVFSLAWALLFVSPKSLAQSLGHSGSEANSSSA